MNRDATVLSRRALNRALLARQHLLARSNAKPIDIIEQLAGMQAQVPRPPFVGIWTRVQKFEREDLIALYASKKVVRATAMRGTIHLLSTKDFLHFRPRLTPMLAKGAETIVRKRVGMANVEPFYKAGREFFSKNAAPELIRPVTNLLPLTLLNDALREISVQGASLWDVRMQIVGLLVWTVFGFILAVRLFRFEKF